MKRLRRIMPALLLVLAALSGCSTPPAIQTSNVNSPVATTMSCTERSAAARPPKHPIVELAWCIAETDNLFDPDHLFRETLGIKTYGKAKEMAWGLQSGVGGAKDFQYLPKGISGFYYKRQDPKGISEPGNRQVGFGIDSQDSCVRMADIAATFGNDYWLSPIPIEVPAPVLPGMASPPPGPKLNPYGIFFKSPRLFMRDASGSVSFDFQYRECVTYITVQRSLGFMNYQHLREGRK